MICCQEIFGPLVRLKKVCNIPVDKSTKIKSMQALNSLHVEYAS